MDERPQDNQSSKLSELLISQHEKDMQHLSKQIDDGNAVVNRKLVAIYEDQKKKHQENVDRIATLENKMNNKLDVIDVALRGNGRIGIFEQLRSLFFRINVLFAIVILLLGFKLWGLGFDDWVKGMFFKQATVHVEPPSTTVKP